jgi:hypothetical protein
LGLLGVGRAAFPVYNRRATTRASQ